MPWITTLRNDVATVQLLGFFSGSPSFGVNPEHWASRMAHKLQWKHKVVRIHFVESSCDCAQAPGDNVAARALSFRCPSCTCAFSSQKALDSHTRAKHGVR